MADKNIQKALYGPSYLEVALGAILGIAIGIAAAFLYFIFKPVEKVTQLPKEPVANVVYFIPGKESSARSKGWPGKLKTFTTGGEIMLREEELNAWGESLSDYKPVDPKAPVKPAAAPKTPPKPGAPGKADEPPAVEPPQVFFAASAPNFSIKDNRVQIALVCKLNYYGIGTDVWVKVTGRFTRTADTYKFTPEEFYFGSCPLHLIPGASAIATNRILAELKITDEMIQAWGRVSLIVVEGEQLKVVTKQ